MAKQGPEFYVKLARFRAMKTAVHDRCRVYEEWEEDLHRKAVLETPGFTVERRECHLMQLDSKGFAKVLKRKSSIQTRECRTVSVFPMQHLSFSHPHGVVADIVTNFVYRGALKRKLLPLVPSAAADAGAAAWWDNATAYATAFDAFADTPSAVAAEPFTPYNNGAMASLTPGYYTIAMIQDPVAHFRTLWSAGAADREAGGLGELSVLQFLEHTDRYRAHPLFSHLYNPELFHFCGVRTAVAAESRQCFKTMYQSFRKVLIADRLLDSLIMLRREVCWDRHDIIHFNIPVDSSSEGAPTLTGSPDVRSVPAFSATLAAKIRAFNAVDTAMFEKFLTTLDTKIAEELAWDEGVFEMTQWVKEARSLCARFVDIPQTTLIDAVTKIPKILFYPIQESACQLQLLSPSHTAGCFAR